MRPIAPIDLSVEQSREQAERNRQRQEAGYFHATSGAAQRFRMKTEHDDYLVCRTYDGTSEGMNDVNVAKPPNLRGDTSTRTNGSDTENIFPEYTTDGDLWADRPVGGTGVEVSGSPVMWLDKNNDARTWTVNRDCGA